MLTDEEICCDQMLREMYRYRRKELYEDGTKIAEIGYDESQRAYHILNSRDPDNNDGLAINYCPWCGKKLPERLEPWAWIEYEYGEEYVTAYDDPKYKPLPPEIEKEFSTDAWWKNRHLDDPKVLAKWCKKIRWLTGIPLGTKMC